MIAWSAPVGKMLRFTGKCGEREHCQWSDWHGSATKNVSAETAQDGNAIQILIKDFSCSLAPCSRFVLNSRGVLLCFIVVFAMAVFLSV